MTNIACLGWGSLIWDPRELPIRSDWFEDGPLLPVEFVRQSGDGRITLVIVPDARPVPSLWTLMNTDDLPKAIKALAEREGPTSIKNIGSWSSRNPPPSEIPGLDDWAVGHDVDHVIWTNLRPKFGGEKRMPTVDEVVSYLQSRVGNERDLAEKYIRYAPRQIDTDYRRRIVGELNWSAQDPASPSGQ